MGLDMYLNARKFHRTQYEANDAGQFVPLPKAQMDGFDLTYSTMQVEYWRKNHWLHGFIVSEFAEEDNCEEIHMDCEKLETICQTLEEWRDNPDYLEGTEGFFFGDQDDEWRDMCRERIPEDVASIRKAIEWLNKEDFDTEWREVYYQASW